MGEDIRSKGSSHIWDRGCERKSRCSLLSCRNILRPTGLLSCSDPRSFAIASPPSVYFVHDWKVSGVRLVIFSNRSSRRIERSVASLIARSLDWRALLVNRSADMYFSRASSIASAEFALVEKRARLIAARLVESRLSVSGRNDWMYNKRSQLRARSFFKRELLICL